MRRLLTLFFLLPLTIVVIALSVANRHTVRLSLDPTGMLSGWSATVPLFVLFFAALAIGVLIGGIATWMRQRKWRLAARRERADAQRLRHEVERLRERVTLTPAIAGPRVDRDAA